MPSRSIVLLLCLPLVIHNSAKPLRDAKDPQSNDKVDKNDLSQYLSSLKDLEEKKDDEEQFIIFEGDIILSSNEMKRMKMSTPLDQDFIDDSTDVDTRSKRRAEPMSSGMKPSQTLTPSSDATFSRVWPNCEVPFKYDQRLPFEMRMTFIKAMALWEKATCIDFIPATAHHTDFLLYKKSDICSSHVGRRGGGVQEVTLSADCSKLGQATHELGHAIGLWHEHSRLDRDNYIEIHKQNIQYRRDYVNFDIISRNTFNEVPDVGYDIQSIMHYSPFAFAESRTPGGETITLREDADLPELGCANTMEMGQRERLSYKDKKRASTLYNCDFDLVEPECITPTTTLPETTTEAPTTMPTPSATITTVTPSKPLKLNSGNILAFSFGDGALGMKCVPSPGCVPMPCHDHGGNTCHAPDLQFQIINHHSISSRRIKSSNTVLLRSVNTPTSWLDCSDATRCIISPCTEDNPDDGANSSYISNCSRHHFQVFGVGRGDNKVLNNQHKLKFKYHNSDDGYLNCNGKRCILLQEGSCPANKGLKLPFVRDTKTGQCLVESFAVDLLSQI